MRSSIRTIWDWLSAWYWPRHPGYVGYERITDALALCSQTTQKVPLLGCTSGVFMEYFTPLVETDGVLSQGRRPFDVTRPLAPCDIVSEDYKASCFFELGHWLYSQFPQDMDTLRRTCDGAPSAYQKYCYLGLGDTRGPATMYNEQDSIAFCSAFSHAGEVYCRAGVAWSFFANPAHRDRKDSFCALASEADSLECTRLADLTLGQANQ